MKKIKGYKMKKLIMVMSLMLCCFCMNGCLSYMSYKASENEIYSRQIVDTKNPLYIKQLDLGIPSRRVFQSITKPGMYGIGVNLLAIDVIQEHPWRQFGAVVADAAATYFAIDQININVTINN